jgi:hypothetical protein
MTISNKQKVLLFLLIYWLAALLSLFLWRPNYLFSIFIVLALPTLAVWLSLKNSRGRVFVFALFSLLLFAPPLELMARLANAWDVASVLPRLWGLAPIENLFFAWFNFWLGLSLYEFFNPEKSKGKMSKRFYWLIGLYVGFFITVAILFKINPAWVTFDYYKVAILAVLIPLTFFVWWWPALLKKSFKTTLILGTVFFVYEIIALQFGYWWWPGKYLWPIMIEGKIFPIDDVIFWYILSTPALIGGYEFFAKGRMPSLGCCQK